MCSRCALLESELRTVMAQLKESRAREGRLNDALGRANEYVRSLHAERSTRDQKHSRVDAIAQASAAMCAGEVVSEPADDHPAVMAKFRVTPGFPWRYVPPLDFLPEAFVDEFADVLAIVDGYAQEFHRRHVGGSRTSANRGGNDLEQQCTFLRSRVALLEAQLKGASRTAEALEGRLSATSDRGGTRHRSLSQRSASVPDVPHVDPSSLVRHMQHASHRLAPSLPPGEGSHVEQAESTVAQRISQWRRRRRNEQLILPQHQHSSTMFLSHEPPSVIEQYYRSGHAEDELT